MLSKAQTALPAQHVWPAVLWEILGAQYLELSKHGLPVYPNVYCPGCVMWNSCLTVIGVLVFIQQEMIG